MTDSARTVKPAGPTGPTGPTTLPAELVIVRSLDHSSGDTHLAVVYLVRGTRTTSQRLLALAADVAPMAVTLVAAFITSSWWFTGIMAAIMVSTILRFVAQQRARHSARLPSGARVTRAHFGASSSDSDVATLAHVTILNHPTDSTDSTNPTT